MRRPVDGVPPFFFFFSLFSFFLFFLFLFYLPPGFSPSSRGFPFVPQLGIWYYFIGPFAVLSDLPLALLPPSRLTASGAIEKL